MILHHDRCRLGRLGRLAGAAVTVGAGLTWAAALGRLQLRALHVLQLEGYQTGRYLRWSLQHPRHWITTAGLLGALTTIAPALADLRAGTRLTRTAPALLSWGVLGGWRWYAARPGPSTKPLALTARAKRLLVGQSALTFSMACVPALICARSARSRQQAIPRLLIGTALASLSLPLLTAGANLLLWPVEEGFRRYYLRDARRKLRAVAPTVVAVAGSYGKTSTKELTAAILAARYNVLKPPGSYNTPMGISRILREQLLPSHEVFVAELGDYVPGDIRFLCDLVGPSVGILTTIGPEHLERFKTMERIVQTKQELIDALPADGIAVINQDDPLVRSLGERAAARGLRVIRYGQTEPGAEVRARDVQTTRDGLSFTVEADGPGDARAEARFTVGLLGRHNVMNLLAATSAALALGMALPEIAAAARRVQPVEHRLQPIQGAGGVLVIDDTYNSNPRGAAEALTVLGELPGGQKILVTPGMVELADREAEEHRILGERAAAVCDHVILVGPERTRPIAEGLLAAGFPEERLHRVASRDGATAILGTLLTAGDVVLWENDLPDTYAEEPGDLTPPARHPSSESTGLRRSAPMGPLDPHGLSGAEREETDTGGLGMNVDRAGTGKPAPTDPGVGAGFQQPAAASPDPNLPRLLPPLRRGEAVGIKGPHGRVADRGGEGIPGGEVNLHGGAASLTVDGLRTVYREDGPPDAPPVVVLHGWGASIAAIGSIQASLRATHRTIALDLPGFGASDPPPAPWGGEEYARHVRAFLQQLGITRASFIGHSHGGRVSIVLAATHPELVDKLVLVDSAGIRPKRTAGYYARVYSYKASRTLLGLPVLAGPLGAPLRRQFETRAGSDDYRQAGSMRGTLVRVVNEDWRHLLPRIQAPTLLIWGEHDDATPVTDGQLMERLIPDAGLVIFPGAGHFAYADDPDRFARVVGHFLTR